MGRTLGQKWRMLNVEISFFGQAGKFSGLNANIVHALLQMLYNLHRMCAKLYTRLERWSIFHADGMVMVFFSPVMEW